jgi:hypothetical protein
MLGLSNPILEGAYLGFTNLVNTETTNWIPLSASDFINSKTGLPLSAGLIFGGLTIVNLSNDTIYLRLRNGDILDATEGEVSIGASSVFSFNVYGLRGDIPLTTIQIKKASSTDEVQVLSTFNPATI